MTKAHEEKAMLMKHSTNDHWRGAQAWNEGRSGSSRRSVPSDRLALTIRSKRIKLNGALGEHVERAIAFALAPFSGAIRQVIVFLADNNGPRGGTDKHCRIDVQLRGGTVRVEDCDTSLMAAVNRAADRVGHAVSRRLSRRRTLVIRRQRPAKRAFRPELKGRGAGGEDVGERRSDSEGGRE